MKTFKITLMVLLAAVFLSAPLSAGQKGKMMDDDHRQMYSKMMKERQQMMDDVLGMLKETMVIVRDLNHKADGAQKQKLDEMISKMDDVMKRHTEMHKMMKEKYKEKKEMKKMMRDNDDKM